MTAVQAVVDAARSAGVRQAQPARLGAAARAGTSDATRLADHAEPVPAREQARWVRRRRADKPPGPAERKKAHPRERTWQGRQGGTI